MRRPRFLQGMKVGVVALAAALLWSCSQSATQEADGDVVKPRPLLIVGIDGAEWSVIRDLWEQGRLPNFRAIAERGVTAELRTRYSISPVIWTTIATGRMPREHGITDFVVPTEHGDLPVSSSLRKVPAIWNMLTTAKRRVGVINWWASWPAEEVDGIIVSDRFTIADEDRFSPPEFAERFERIVGHETAEDFGFLPGSVGERDHGTAHLGRELIRDDLDLLMVYFRGVDIASHHHWKHYRPATYDGEIPTEELEEFRDRVPDEYEAVDRAIGAILAAAPEGDREPNVMVISDHGFHAARPEIVKVELFIDQVLEELGFLERNADGGVDLENSKLYAFSSPGLRLDKYVRIGSAHRGAKQTILKDLERELTRITYANGESVFDVRPPKDKERRKEIDVVVVVRQEGASEQLLLDGEPALADAVGGVQRVSGNHGDRTHGVLLAAGPDIDPDFDATGIRIFDMAPTMLYGLGLPTAEDFAGRAFTGLFRKEFRDLHPLRTIPTWGTLSGGEARATDQDEAIVEELRALGYLD